MLAGPDLILRGIRGVGPLSGHHTNHVYFIDSQPRRGWLGPVFWTPRLPWWLVAGPLCWADVCKPASVLPLTRKFGMLRAEDGATYEVDLEQIGAGWQANYRVMSANGDQTETPGLRVFPAKADAVAWITDGLAAHGFAYEESD